MPGPGGRDFQQSCNCQAVVADEPQVVLEARATSAPNTGALNRQRDLVAFDIDDVNGQHGMVLTRLWATAPPGYPSSGYPVFRAKAD